MGASFQPALSANFRRVESPEALRNLGSEANLGELTASSNRPSDSEMRELAAMRRGANEERAPISAAQPPLQQTNITTLPPETARQAAPSAAPLSAQSIREQVNIPTAEQFPRLSVDELRERYAASRAVLEPEVEKRRDQFTSMGFSGRGEGDLERIFQNKRCSDSRNIQAFGLAGLRGSSSATLFDNLEEATVHAAGYATLKNETRLQTDPEPGGVMVLALKAPVREGLIGSNSVRPWDRGEYLVERTFLTLNPDTFDQTVLGAIGYNRFGPMHAVAEKMSAEFGRVEAERERAPFGHQSIPGLITQGNEFYERIFIARQFLALSLIVDTIALMET